MDLGLLFSQFWDEGVWRTGYNIYLDNLPTLTLTLAHDARILTVAQPLEKLQREGGSRTALLADERHLAREGGVAPRL